LAQIETTIGSIPIERMGRVNAHEHVITDGGLTVIKEPDFKLDSVEKAIEEVNRWKTAGGGLLMDTMPTGAGRNVDKLIAVSQGTGIPILVATGFHKTMYYLPDHWQHSYPEETIAELLLAECMEGVDRNNYNGPVVNRSAVQAGVLKIATDYQFIAPVTQKIIRAAGRVHRACQVPILVHSEMGTMADELLNLLDAAGVPLNRVVISHIDRNPDFYLHCELARRGAFLQYDTPGRIKYQPEHIVIDLMRRLFDAGLGSQIVLGGDMARRSYWKAYGGGPGLDYLLTHFTPRLRREGFTESEIEQLWEKNPACWLTPDRAKT